MRLGTPAAREDSETIRDALRETDIVFLTAGLGGGAGTGSLPVIAEKSLLAQCCYQ